MGHRVTVLLLAGALLLCACVPTQAAATHPSSSKSPSASNTVIWRGGAGDSRWSNPANWDGGRVPTANDAARIPADAGDTLVDPAFGGHVAKVWASLNNLLVGMLAALGFKRLPQARRFFAAQPAAAVAVLTRRTL